MFDRNLLHPPFHLLGHVGLLGVYLLRYNLIYPGNFYGEFALPDRGTVLVIDATQTGTMRDDIFGRNV